MIILFGSNIYDLFFHMANFPDKDQAVHLGEHEERPGGKGANQAVAAAKAGSKVRFFGALGNDDHGHKMRDNLQEEGIDVSGVEMLEDEHSGLATIFVDENDGTHRVVVSQGANRYAKQDTIPDDLLTPDTILLLQRELCVEEIAKLLTRAKDRGGRAVMNLAPAKEIPESMLHQLDYIILNEYEAESLANAIGADSADKWAFAKYLYDTYELATIITLGQDGSICYCAEGEFEVGTLSINAIDTIGAGDAFSGYFCAAIDQDKSVKDALRIAAVASCLACTKVGAMTALPSQEEVAKLLPQIKINQRNINAAA